MTQIYPLQWPDGMPRTQHKTASQFRTTLAQALENVTKSLELFGKDTGNAVTKIVLSSNVAGLASKQPDDTGVAAWFMWEAEQRSIAVDRYEKVADNLQAIHHILEARRTEMRHGGLHIVRQTFKGFAALPPPEPWWLVLGVAQSADMATIEDAFRTRAAYAHPDKGGSAEAMSQLNRARAAAKVARA